MVAATGRPVRKTGRRYWPVGRSISLPPVSPDRDLGASRRGYVISRISYFVVWVARELRVYRMMSRDSRTPVRSKILLWAAVGYAFWPLGLIPDFIPVVGYVDDLIIVPTLIFIAVRGLPDEVARECRHRAG